MKTVIGGASIIDLMILVVDCQKLIQTQTAECIVLGEILMDKLLVAFNKVDLFKNDPKMHQSQLKKLQAQIGRTKFGVNATIIEVNAVPSSDSELDIFLHRESVQKMISEILNRVEIPDRTKGTNKDFLFSIDHCFQIKGQGTVLTGTVLSGKIKVGDMLELPLLKIDKKVKSIQMFRKPVQSIKQGDRAGICVAQLDADLIERGIASAPRTVKTSDVAIVILKRVPYFVGEVKTKSKYHISIGHSTAVGEITLFSCPEIPGIENFNKNSLKSVDSVIKFDFKRDYFSEESMFRQLQK